MKPTELLQEQLEQEKTVRPLYSEKELKELKEQEKKDLEQINQPLAGTYIVCRQLGEEKYIGTIGGYKVTEEHTTIEALTEEVHTIKNNAMYPIVTALAEMLFSEIEKLNENK